MLKKVAMGVVLMAAIGSQTAWADLLLWEYAFNVDGTIYSSLDGPVEFDGLDQTGYDPETGLGMLSLTISGEGSHSINSFIDIEMSQDVNTWFNEIATVSGTPDPRLIWEVDEPGYVFGDIYNHFVDGTFDNSIFDGEDLAEDVSVGLGWNFTLAAGETATLTYNIGSLMPAGGFYITHSDPESGENAYFTTNLNISGGGPQPVPEPASAGLVLIGSLLIGALAAKRRK